MANMTSHHLYPPFPTDFPTAPLVSISLFALESGNPTEQSAFWDAAQNLGFFYLDMSGSLLGERVVRASEELKLVMDQLMALPLEEKQRYQVNEVEKFFGYRRKDFAGDGSQVTESYNIKKDDLVGLGTPLPRPALIDHNWELLENYARDCRNIIDLLLSILDTKLGLTPGTLYALHRLDAPSGDHVRFNRHNGTGFDEVRAKNAEHTDFGTLTVLFNWLGGLQIRLPPGVPAVEPSNTQTNGKTDAPERQVLGSDTVGSPESSGEWVWVKPIPGKAIINLGDALVKFTAGILRSNVHRVVPPPESQNSKVRDSLVFFSRPENEVILKRLSSGLIDLQPRTEDEDQPGIRSDEWILRRATGDLVGVYTHEGGLERRTYWQDPAKSKGIKA